MYRQVPFIELVYMCGLNTLWCFYCMCGIYLCGERVKDVFFCVLVNNLNNSDVVFYE